MMNEMFANGAFTNASFAGVSEVLAGVSVALIMIGAVFFLAGTVGLLRFPDVHSRLHALSKADNLGLGFIAIALALRADSPAIAVKIVVIWLLALLASGATCFLVSNWKAENGNMESDI